MVERTILLKAVAFQTSFPLSYLHSALVCSPLATRPLQLGTGQTQVQLVAVYSDVNVELNVNSMLMMIYSKTQTNLSTGFT